jgi:IclR helix-turn-helix domain
VRHRVKPASHAGTSEHQARIYALLDEDRSRKPAELQRLTGIPKATVYRLVERYHRDHPSNETTTPDETETHETVRREKENAS